MGGNSARANSRPFFPETSSSHEARKIKLDGWLFLLKIVKASFAVDNLVVDNKGLQAINDYVTGSKTFEQARNTLIEMYRVR